MLDGILRWMDDVRKKYFGYEEASQATQMTHPAQQGSAIPLDNEESQSPGYSLW